MLASPSSSSWQERESEAVGVRGALPPPLPMWPRCARQREEAPVFSPAAPVWL